MFSHDFLQSAIKAKGTEPGESVAHPSSRLIYNLQLFLEGLSLPPSVNIYLGFFFFWFFWKQTSECLWIKCIGTVRVWQKCCMWFCKIPFFFFFSPRVNHMNLWTKGSVLWVELPFRLPRFCSPVQIGSVFLYG